MGIEIKRNQVLEAITAPLGFFVLALLIVESFLAIILTSETFKNKGDMVTGMYIGVGLFIFITIVVTLLVWYKPDNLTFDKEAHLRNKGKPPFGSNDNLITSQDTLKISEPKE